MSYLLDAETCATILRRLDGAVLERLSRIPVAEVEISAVTLAELQYGVEASRRSVQDRAAVEALLKHVAVRDFPREAAKEYGVVRMVLELCETPVPEEVMLAAAHARHHGWTLVTPYAEVVARVHEMKTERWGDDVR